MQQEEKTTVHEQVHGRVLLVDDDDFLLDMYSRKFAQEGYEVRHSLSVAEALDALRGGYDPDAVVFDLVMPQQGGLDLLRLIKEEKLAPRSKLVALTNQWEDDMRAKIEEYGADAYIIKAEAVPSEIVKKVHDIIQGTGAKTNA